MIKKRNGFLFANPIEKLNYVKFDMLLNMISVLISGMKSLHLIFGLLSSLLLSQCFDHCLLWHFSGVY